MFQVGRSRRDPATWLSPPELDRFRSVQRLAYRCAEEVAGRLQPGITERQAAGMMRRWLEANGVDDWFHVPFAWFGDRSAFRGFRWSLQFFPTNRALEDGMPFILDMAPIVRGYTADIGYAHCLGRNPTFDRLIADLARYRELILDRVRAGCRLRQIWEEVDHLITAQGYENRHKVYPGRVIAHQVWRLPPRGPRAIIAGFGVRTLQTLGRELVLERLRGRSPLWADKRASDHPPTPGLWAVEPHIGFRGVGVKFEEILVVTDHDAFWLDDDLPHLRRWREAA
jgi:Xaa-Pro aminopeptidase